MNAQPLESQRFVRRTQLAPGEYRRNFHQIDRDVVEAVSSPEADKITPLMSKIYLRLVNAPVEFQEREGVLRFEGGARKERQVGAWAILCEVLGVASATASKALQWMHEQGIIGYFAGKNGVGIRIFLNRASSSIGIRPGTGSKKILAFTPASSVTAPASRNEAAFNDSFAVRENLDTDKNPRAPKRGAQETKTSWDRESPGCEPVPTNSVPVSTPAGDLRSSPLPRSSGTTDGDALVERLASEIVPRVTAAAALEHERTREWFINHALPKAVRVSQRSAYDVLRAHGVITGSRPRNSRSGQPAGLEVGRHLPSEARPRTLSEDEILALAESCVALLEAQGQSIDCTLSEMSIEAGGLLRAEDAPKVRARAEALIGENEPGSKGRGPGYA